MVGSDLQQLSIIETIIVHTVEACGLKFSYTYIHKSSTNLRMLAFICHSYGLARELAIYPPNTKNQIGFILMGKIHHINIDKNELKRVLKNPHND